MMKNLKCLIVKKEGSSCLQVSIRENILTFLEAFRVEKKLKQLPVRA